MIFSLSFLLVFDKYCFFCPSDCESTQYVFETSTAWRTPRDTSYLIKSYSKKNKLLDNVKKEIAKLDAMCITPEEKEIRLEELKQFNKSIAYTSTMIQFFWKEDTMVSYVRDQHYTIVDMMGIILLTLLINTTINVYIFYFMTISYFSKFWRCYGMCNWNVCGCCM